MSPGQPRGAYSQLVEETYGIANVPPGTRTSTYDNAEYLEAAPFATRTLEAIGNADPNDSTLNPSPYVGVQFAAIPEFQSIATQVGKLISGALAGSMSVDHALKAAQSITPSRDDSRPLLLQLNTRPRRNNNDLIQGPLRRSLFAGHRRTDMKTTALNAGSRELRRGTQTGQPPGKY